MRSSTQVRSSHLPHSAKDADHLTDDWFVIAITDANFARYGITGEEIQRAMNRNPKVHTALICIGEGAEATW